jgi:hypothetical protein
MTLPRSAGDVLSDHVTFELESIDRLYCNLYVPQLQRAEGIVGFIRGHLGRPIASTAVIAPMSRDFTARLRSFADAHDIPRIDFVRGQRKDDVMHEHLAAFEAAGRTEGVLFIGRAQEKNTVFRTEKRRAADGRSYPWIVRTTSVVSQFYVHCVDEDFGAYADRPVMPHRMIPVLARAVSGHPVRHNGRAVVSGSQCVEEGQETVGRRVSSFWDIAGCQPRQCLFLQLHVGVQVDACGGRRLMS